MLALMFLLRLTIKLRSYARHFAFVKQSCAAVNILRANCVARVAELFDVKAWLEWVFELLSVVVLWLRALQCAGVIRRRRLSKQSGEGEVTAP